jgi:hypothetical protein
MQKLLFCLFLLTLTLSAADVTGKWSGSFETADAGGETRTSTALLNLKQAGSQITGTVGPNEGEQTAISKGTIDGDKIALEVQNEGRTMQFRLLLAGDRLKGDATMTREGQTRTAKLDLKRDK